MFSSKNEKSIPVTEIPEISETREKNEFENNQLSELENQLNEANNKLREAINKEQEAVKKLQTANQEVSN